MATISAARNRRAEKTYKIKYKALKELEKGTPHKEVAALFIVPRNTLQHGKKNKEKIFQTYKSRFGAIGVKPEKYEALSKAVKKWLLILRSENLPVSEPMAKEKALEFADELALKVSRHQHGG